VDDRLACGRGVAVYFTGRTIKGRAQGVEGPRDQGKRGKLRGSESGGLFPQPVRIMFPGYAKAFALRRKK
jgi:hypothetical protein